MAKLISEGTIELDRGVSVYSCAAAVGKMESDGPLGNCFDYAAEGAELGLTTWEKAESTFQQYAFDIALRKGKLIKEDISFILQAICLTNAQARHTACVTPIYRSSDFTVPARQWRKVLQWLRFLRI